MRIDYKVRSRMTTKLFRFIKTQGVGQLVKCVKLKLIKKWIIVNDYLLLKMNRLHILPNYKIGSVLPLDFTIAQRYDQAAIVQLLMAEKERICSEADTVCSRQFSLLGSGLFKMQRGSDWHLDFKSGFQWNLDYYLDIQRALTSVEHFTNSADIKVPWELSRCHHLPILAQAYCLTGQHKYYQQFKFEIEDWITHNPFKRGPNWVSPMDVAIRVVNWIVAAEGFALDMQDDQDFNYRFNQQLIAAGHFVANNIERDAFGHGNNHYLSNLVGLVFIGIHLRGAYDKAEKWVNQGAKGLLREINYQVHDDGGGFEGSVSYHRFSTEMFLLTTILLTRHGRRMNTQYLEKLEKMCACVAHYTKPNGKAPIFGDADDGRLLTLGTFGNEDKRDHRHILATAGMFFKRGDWLLLAGDQTREAKWLFGELNVNFKALTDMQPLFTYPDTGMYIFKLTPVYIAIKCGAIGLHGRGGHDHNDQLSYVLNIAGDDIVVDCGTFVYTADKDKRQRFRSTACHNVAQYQQYEQNAISCNKKADLFKMDSANAGEVISIDAIDGQLSFNGKILNHSSDVYTYRRLIYNQKAQYIEVNDWFEGELSSVKDSFSRLHLSNQVDIVQIDHRTVHLKTALTFIEVTSDCDIVVESCLISPSYGRAYASKRLVFSMSKRCTYRLSYRLIK